jgi:hypothetical protein
VPKESRLHINGLRRGVYRTAIRLHYGEARAAGSRTITVRRARGAFC